MSRAYHGIESLALNATQKQTLITALREWGANNQDDNPCNRNHWRVRLDGDAVIFEADWQVSEWTIDSLKARLGDIFGIDPATIDHTTAQTARGPVVTYSRNGTDYLRQIVFGGVSATYAESHAEVLSYLAANAADWEAPV